MATRIATAWRCRAARHLVVAARRQAAAVRIAAACRGCAARCIFVAARRYAAVARIAAACRALSVAGRQQAAAAAARQGIMATRIAAAWRCRAARRRTAASRAALAGGGAVLARVRLSLRAAPLEAMEPAATTGGRFRVALLGGGGGAEHGWLCPPARVLDKVRAAWPGAAIRGRFPADLSAAEVEAASAAGELVVLDSYGAAVDIAIAAEGDGRAPPFTRSLGLVQAGGLVLVRARILTGFGVADTVLELWFQREATLRSVAERCRTELGRTAPVPMRVAADSARADAAGDAMLLGPQVPALHLDTLIANLVAKGGGCDVAVRLCVDLRGRPEVVVELRAAGAAAGAGREVASLPLDFLAASLCGTIAPELQPDAGGEVALYPPPPPGATLEDLIRDAADPTADGGGDAEAEAELLVAAAELFVVRGDAVQHVAASPGAATGSPPRTVYAFLGKLPAPSPPGGLSVTVGGEPPPEPPRARPQTQPAGGCELHLWPVLPGDTAGDVLTLLAALGVLGGDTEDFEVLLPDGLAATADAALPDPLPPRAWAARRDALVPLAVAVTATADGCSVLVLHAAPGSRCETVAERAGAGVGDRLVCGGVAVPADWTVADLPRPAAAVHDALGSPLLAVAPAQSLVTVRLSVSLEAAADAAAAPAASRAGFFPAEVEIVRCGRTLCAALVDVAAAAHGGCAQACILTASPCNGGPPFEVDLGEDGGSRGGSTLEELAAELATCGPLPTLAVGLHGDAQRLAAAVASDGCPASPPRAIFAARGMAAAAVCHAALAAHSVPATTLAVRTAALWFRSTFPPPPRARPPAPPPLPPGPVSESCYCARVLRLPSLVQSPCRTRRR
jgi:hypothetical protein